MGGTAFAKSKGLGQGSSFYFCIPHSILDCETFNEDVLYSTPTIPSIPAKASEPIEIPSSNGILFADVLLFLLRILG